VLLGGDVCYFAGDVVDVVDLLEISGLSSAEDVHLVGAGDRPDAGLFEAVVSERSELAGCHACETRIPRSLRRGGPGDPPPRRRPARQARHGRAAAWRRAARARDARVRRGSGAGTATSA
jgi:hypothetical protein